MNKSFQQIEAEAKARARSSQRARTPGIYVPESSTPVTPERAIAEALESDPEVYEAYRSAHNAQPLVNTLTKAGFRLRAS